MLFYNNFILSQQEKINQIRETLNLADSLYHSNNFDKAINKASEVYYYDFEIVIIPETNDQKWNNNMRLFRTESKCNASFILGQAYYKKEMYDSSLFFLNQVSIPINYASIHNYTYSLEFDIHLSYLKSVCFERINLLDTALTVLTNYLFLDQIQSSIPDWYTQKDLVDRYKSIEKNEIEFDINKVVLIPKDSIRFFSWHQYQGFQTNVYYKVGREFCPILPKIEYQNLFNELVSIKENKDPSDPFQQISKEINYQKVGELLPLLNYFKKE